MAEKYRTIVADPPWHYDPLPVGRAPKGVVHDGRSTPLPFPSLTVEEIAALPVDEVAASDAHLYLWTTNRYLRPAFDVMVAWGFRYSQTLAWCKTPMGLGPGATFANTLEFILVGKRGRWPRFGAGIRRGLTGRARRSTVRSLKRSWMSWSRLALGLIWSCSRDVPGSDGHIGAISPLEPPSCRWRLRDVRGGTSLPAASGSLSSPRCLAV